MRQIKAFVRSSCVQRVVSALEAAGVPGVTVSSVHGVGHGYEPEHFSLAPRDVAPAPQIAKLEVVCAAQDADRLVRVIVDAARSGLAGDGIVYVAPVERAVKVRTGQEGARGARDPGSAVRSREHGETSGTWRGVMTSLLSEPPMRKAQEREAISE